MLRKRNTHLIHVQGHNTTYVVPAWPADEQPPAAQRCESEEYPHISPHTALASASSLSLLDVQGLCTSLDLQPEHSKWFPKPTWFDLQYADANSSNHYPHHKQLEQLVIPNALLNIASAQATLYYY